MPIDPVEILSLLDDCCDSFEFPMLDNGYTYLAATRLSLFRSAKDWALVFEIFGFSPRGGLPDTHIQTFASRLHNRDKPKDYVTREAYQNYLADNPHNEYRSVWPVARGVWQDANNLSLVAKDAKEVVVRKKAIPLPRPEEYRRRGIKPKGSSRVEVFELCRYLAEVEREWVLATPRERRVSVRPEMKQILQLEEWHHPNVVDEDERPSRSQTFRQLAEVLATGDVKRYRPTREPNTHWRNWPEGGTL
jgi:hypothetical protein